MLHMLLWPKVKVRQENNENYCGSSSVLCEMTVRSAAPGEDREKAPLYPPCVNSCLHTISDLTQ